GRAMNDETSLWRQLAFATNWPVLVAVLVLTSFGILSIYADSPDDAIKQTVFAVIGLVLLVSIQMGNYQVLARCAWAFYLRSLVPVLYTVVGATIGNGQKGDHPLPFVYNVNGAYAWLTVGPVGLQPAELVKISFIMVMAHYLRYRSNYRTFIGLMA